MLYTCLSKAGLNEARTIMFLTELVSLTFLTLCPEAATGGVLDKKVLLEISQNSQENTCARVSFLMNFIKKETPGKQLCQSIFF